MPGPHLSRPDAVLAASGWAFPSPPASRPGNPAAGAEVWLEASASPVDAVSVAAAAAAAGCGLVQVSPVVLAAVAARLRSTPVRVAARVAGPGALATTQLFDAGECLRLGADEIAWPAPGEPWEEVADGPVSPLSAAAISASASPAIAAAAALCHAAGARLKLLATRPENGLEAFARQSGADSLAVLIAAGESATPAGAIARIWQL